MFIIKPRKKAGIKPAFSLFYWYLPFKIHFERHEGFCSRYSFNILKIFVDDLLKVLVCFSLNFYKNSILAGCKMAFHNFRNFTKCLNNLFVKFGLLEMNAHISAGIVSQFLRINDKFTSRNNSNV